MGFVESLEMILELILTSQGLVKSTWMKTCHPNPEEKEKISILYILVIFIELSFLESISYKFPLKMEFVMLSQAFLLS